MTRLEQTEVCQDCGRPYRTSDGHNCPGPRRLAPAPENETAAATSPAATASSPSRSTGRNQQ
jgi:hypothetical protein